MPSKRKIVRQERINELLLLYKFTDRDNYSGAQHTFSNSTFAGFVSTALLSKHLFKCFRLPSITTSSASAHRPLHSNQINIQELAQQFDFIQSVHYLFNTSLLLYLAFSMGTLPPTWDIPL